MANRNQRFYCVAPCPDGTGILAMFYNNRWNRSMSVMDNIMSGNATFWDKMPLNELLEVGADCIQGGIAAGQQYAATVRMTKIQDVINKHVTAPADPQELAKFAAFMDGIVLDPGAEPVHVQQALEKAHEEEEREAPPEE